MSARPGGVRGPIGRDGHEVFRSGPEPVASRRVDESRAGVTGATNPVTEFPVESWRRVIDVNLTGLFYCCRETVPFMLKNGYGRVVNIASVAGKEGNPNASAYSASKAGVIGFTLLNIV